MCEWGRVLQQLLATKHAIRDDKVSPLISTYLKAHSRACAHLARLLLRHGLLIGEVVDRTDL